jgi:hypothetical protein
MESNTTDNKFKGCIAAALPFPPISWWARALKAGEIWLDPHEHIQKMTYRNRYYLASKEGKALLSIPLVKGRNQHIPMKDVGISYAEDWQKNHWRTIQTLLGNSPFFEFLDYQLFPFFKERQENLYAFNKASIEWVNHFLGKPILIHETDRFYTEADLDLRPFSDPKQKQEGLQAYYQVFHQKNDFVADCSVLDLICCEGKRALEIIRNCLID